MLGRAKTVKITKDNTTIIDGAGSEDDIKARIDADQGRDREQSDSDFDQEKLQERLAKLSGGVAVIKVGAATEVELKEKKHRIEDALQATRAAVEEGIVARRRRRARERLPGARQAQARRRRDDRRRHHPQGARRAAARPSRPTPASRAPSWSRRSRRMKKGEGLNSATGEYGDLRQDGRHRPGEGHALGAAERRVDRPRSSSSPRRPSPTSPSRRTPALPRPVWRAWAAGCTSRSLRARTSARAPEETPGPVHV